MHNTRLFYTIFLLLPILFSGCIKEELDDCPPDYNLTVTFRFTDGNGVGVFPQYVHTVDLFLYDKGGLFLSRHTIDQTSLDQFQGAKLNLMPGEYTIVCWANLSTLTTINANLQTLVHADMEKGISSDGDPMHYAPQTTLTIPTTGTVEKSIDFCCAHRTVEVFVKGFTDTPATILPQVELTQIPRGYDFSMNTLNGNNMCYAQRAVEATLPSGLIAATRFHTPHFNMEDPIQIYIKKPSNEQTLYTVNLNDFLRDNGMTLGDTPQDTIQVMIEFMETNVKVTMPLWDGNDVEPEF